MKMEDEGKFAQNDAAARSLNDAVLYKEEPEMSLHLEVDVATSAEDAIASKPTNKAPSPSKKKKKIVGTNKKRLPKMCLEDCHKFHTNPAVSGPNNKIKRANKDTEKSTDGTESSVPHCPKGSTSADATNFNCAHVLDDPVTAAQIDSAANSSISGKALKRKQRLAQNEVQSSSQQTNPSTNQTHALSLTSSNLLQPATTKNCDSTGLACHDLWAPNSNFCKNAELLAIASPISIHSLTGANNSGSNPSSLGGSISTGNSSGVAHQNLNVGTGTQAPNHAVGSNVYILVFDEGTFAHCTEFNLSDEVCELFGLPTQRMVSTGTESGNGINPIGKCENDSAPKKEAKCGLRRTVYQRAPLVNDDARVDTRVDTTANGHDNGDDGDDTTFNRGEEDSIQDRQPSSKTCKLSYKVKSMLKNVTTKIIEPLATHFFEEVKNSCQMFQYEVFDDGRIFGAKRVNPGDTVKGSDSEPLKSKPSRKEYTKIGNGASPNIIRPQLVFHINLPYSSTSTEVTGLDWNTDGTTLTITQRRKGTSNSFAAVTTSLTNKKKKPSINSVSPGNTAISFWNIPEWLHVSCEDLKMSIDGRELRYNDGDGIIIKANNSLEDTVGWEVILTDDNKSLFPLWEWYLANYIFHDKGKSKYDEKKKKRSRLLIKNSMEYAAYPMELSSTSSGSPAAIIRSGKKVPRGNRGNGTTIDNANSVINGEITCSFWETSEIRKEDAYLDDEEGDNKKNDDEKSDSKSVSNSKLQEKNRHLIPASKWVAIGTSKGQMILHNNAASLVSYQNKKASKKPGGIDSSKSNVFNASSILPQARTVIVPLRHKKRITCGAWVDNLLVFAHVSTGCLTVVSTAPKLPNDGEITASPCDKTDIFIEKSTKVLGSIPLPGGRDAVDILIGKIEDDLGSVTILSVNCEGKSLLFYTFPKFIDSGNTTSQAFIITSSPATEVNFTMASAMLTDDSILSSSQKKGKKNHGNIIFHYLIPNTLLALVAFSSGYFVLIDWVNGIILSDEDVWLKSRKHILGNDATAVPRDIHDNFLLDITYHVQSSTLACVTQDGIAIVYHIRMLDGCHEVKAGDCTCSTGIAISNKTHTRPNTKATSNVVDCDSSVKRIMGTIDYLCSHTLPFTPSIQPDARNPDLLSFSADGECISVSLGDESVIILSINSKDDECDRLKQKLAESVYLGKDGMFLAFLSIICVVVAIIGANSPDADRVYRDIFLRDFTYSLAN